MFHHLISAYSLAKENMNDIIIYTYTVVKKRKLMLQGKIIFLSPVGRGILVLFKGQPSAMRDTLALRVRSFFHGSWVLQML